MSRHDFRFALAWLVILAAPTTLVADETVIRVLSNRADLISGGDALVEIVGAREKQQIRLNGRDVSDVFVKRGNGRVMGLVTGLDLGENTLRVSGPGGTVETTITNHPNYGPVFSAAQHRIDEEDWALCRSGQPSKLNDCNVAVEYTFLYKSTNPTRQGLIAFDPADGIPGDVATTTTDHGATVPFIVRRELGYQDRDQYTILVLFDPSKAWAPWAPQPQWNQKVFAPHGSNCGMSFKPGSPRLNDTASGFAAFGLEHSYITALGRGFAVVSTALNNNGHNCNVVLQAESMMMVKERLVEQYGELRYMIGTGCSGGAIAQNTMANAYPGLYQGLLTTCTYPDSVSPAVQASDYYLLRKYFEDPGRWAPGVAWSPHQFGLVEGHLSHVNAIAMDELLFKPATRTSGNCAGAETYHPDNNPGGVRCGALEWNQHISGTRPEAHWSDIEKALGRGFTNIPFGNVGIQYGLQALQKAEITPAQFVDLNVKIGGLNVDVEFQEARASIPLDTIANAYRGGAITVGNNLDQVAIINFLGPDPGAAHDSVHAWWVRWRLDREQGHHDNHVMWGGPVALFGDPYYFQQGLLAIDRWLAAVEADRGDDPLPVKITANRPADVHDQCSDGLGHKIADEICVEFQRDAYNYGTPRTVAGADIYASSLSCQLKPFSRDADYGPVPFTEEQWAQLETLFGDGVCDYSQPGHGEETKTVPWLTYQDGSGGVVIGGKEMSPQPLNSGSGWSSPAFRD